MINIIQYINDFINQHKNQFIDWFEYKYKEIGPCFYSSVDLRHSGYKLAPIDTNLFPAGFNNFYGDAIHNAISFSKKYFTNHFPNTRNILILPEYHTRNQFYLDNLISLNNIIKESGFNSSLAIFDDEHEFYTKEYLSGKLNITKIDNNFLDNTNFAPDLIISNNDMTSGIPPLLSNTNIPIVPSSNLGWHTRSKSDYFDKYNLLIKEFCKQFNLESFLITTKHIKCTDINFKTNKGIDIIAENIEILLEQIKQNYKQYNIQDEPYVFVKADQGTYGMGIINVKSGEEILNLNKKQKNKLSSIKGGIKNLNVIIQEGVRTVEYINNTAAEPLVYLIDCNPIGMIYRTNNMKNDFDNLNSKGMSFNMLNELKQNLGTKQNCFYLIAQIASLASCLEKK